MNAIKLIGLILGNNVKDAAAWVKDNVDLSLRLLYTSIGLPLLLLVAGMTVGGLGAEGVGQGLIIAAGFISALLLSLFWVRATVLVNIIVLGTHAANMLFSRVKPLQRDEAESFVRWLRGVTTWATAVCLYAQIIPLWRSIATSAIVATCLIFFAAVLSSGWFQGRAFRIAVTVAVGIIFIGGTIALVNPRFARNVRETVGGSTNVVSDWSERREALNQVQTDAAKRAAEMDKVLLKKLTDRQNALRQRAIEMCNGRFCSDAEAAEYAQIEKDIAAINGGTYWRSQMTPPDQRPSLPPSSAPSGASVSEPPPVGSVVQPESSSARLPPPSVARVTGRPKPPETQTVGDPADPFRELDKYPDLQ